MTRSTALREERDALQKRLAALNVEIHLAESEEQARAARVDWERLQSFPITTSKGDALIDVCATWPEPAGPVLRWMIGVGTSGKLLAVYRVEERRGRFASQAFGGKVPEVVELAVFRRFDLRRPGT